MFTLSNFYKSHEWEKLVSRLKLERVNADGYVICEHCGKPITRKYDCIGHHKVELTEDNVNDYSISLNPDNVALIHFSCHNQIHQRFEGFKQEVYLVYGAPCSGKTSWVSEVANDDDLIIDIDKLWEAVCKSDRYHKPKRLRANVFGLRDALIDQVRTRAGKWRNAFLIGGYPLRSDRDRLCEMLGAKPVFIEEEESDCLARAKTDDWREYVREWFDAWTD